MGYKCNFYFKNNRKGFGVVRKDVTQGRKLVDVKRNRKFEGWFFYYFN